MAVHKLLVFLFAATAFAQELFPVIKLSATGESRLSEQAVLTASGIKLRQMAGESDFAKACDLIVNSGFFRSCNFRYDSATVGGVAGFDLQFLVEEAGELQMSMIEIPGLDEDQLWADLAKQDPLVQKKIPATEEATRHYIAAIELFLKGKGTPRKIKQKIEGRLGGGPMLLVFQPDDLPTVREVIFDGNRAILLGPLRTAILSAAAGSDFTERRFRQLLELNVRPLYEEIGRLNAKFSGLHISTPQGEGTVTIEVDEGPVYQLGNVQIAGDDLDAAGLLKQAAFQTGKMANWRLVEASIEKIQTSLKTQGFLAASIKQNRVLLAGNTVDLTLAIAKGRQYFFGQLTLLGLDDELEKAARLKWNLAPGAPMNEPYVTEYMKSLYTDKRLPSGKKISRDMKVDPTQPGVVNVTIQLK